MASQLRERDPGTLKEMQRNAVSVEANMLIKKSKTKLERPEKKVVFKEEPFSYSDVKLDTLIKTMEIMMDIMCIIDRQAKPSIRNPNFRG